MHPVGVIARRYGLDALIVAATLDSALEVALRRGTLQGPQVSPWFGVPAIALVILPLLGRRRFPFAAPMAVWVVAAALALVDARLLQFTLGPPTTAVAASFLLGQVADPFDARIGLAGIVAGSAVIAYRDPNNHPGELIFVPVAFTAAWLVGFALRQRATQVAAANERATHAEREREAAARVAVAEERARIARELHDIVAHAVSVMVLHVGAVRHKLPGGLTEEVAALHGVERAGRTALAEMRRLLGAMREDDNVELAPHPGLDRLGQLAEEVGRAGLPVWVHVEGDSVPLPEAVDLSAYRIVQEGLTNALKHARASRADVTLRYRPDELQIEVRDDGRGGRPGDGLGHGLVGIRERVKIYGGDMTAGAVAGAGFVLRTRLPLTTGDDAS